MQTLIAMLIAGTDGHSSSEQLFHLFVSVVATFGEEVTFLVGREWIVIVFVTMMNVGTTFAYRCQAAELLLGWFGS